MFYHSAIWMGVLDAW